MTNNTDSIVQVPKKLKAILDKNETLSLQVRGIVRPFSEILKANELYFFPEYTDHGIKHIENTLQYAENLIAEDTFNYLTPEEVGVLLLSVVLHDIGMHTNVAMFKNMIEGKYDDLVGLFPNGRTWKELWASYLYDCQYWGEEKKNNVFGSQDYKNIQKPDLDDLQKLNEYDKKLIGEFLRIHHCRIAHEVSIKGYLGSDNKPFVRDGIDLDPDYIRIAGIVARSHGMDVRDTFEYLEGLSGDRYTPFGIHAVYLMVLLRLADYLQIDSSRTSKTMLSINAPRSSYSLQEHKTHLSIKNVEFTNPDIEKIVIQAHPEDAHTYVKIEWLAEDIQKEFDHSWAILGEVYKEYNYKLRYRRITTNIRNEKYKSKLNYVPQQFGFRYNNDLFKLLIAPLYGDNPSYGVRELVQNAVDACRLCIEELPSGDAHVKVVVDSKNMLFTIIDKGKGMNLQEIENYFLTIGSSYNENIDWKKIRDDEHIYRTGRFGIGVLAAFLLGSEIRVVTKKRDGKEGGYRFKASLNDKFIQIEKEPNAEYGTRIEINCNEACIESLRKNSGWYRWYIDETPKVEYFFDGICKTPEFDLKGYKELKHSSNKFGNVYWKPTIFTDNWITDNVFFDGKSLYCNGFRICEHSKKYRFSLNGFDKFMPLCIPSLQITDVFNQLPLNLQRNEIAANVKYDFEPELAKEMFIDMLCQLMAINSNFNDLAFEHFNFHHNGFSLRKRYMTSRIVETKSINIYHNGKRYYPNNNWIDCYKMIPPELILHYNNLDADKGFVFNNILSNRNFSFFAMKDSTTSRGEKVKNFYKDKLQKFNNWIIYAPKKSLEESLFIEMIKIIESIDRHHRPIELVNITKLGKSPIFETCIDDVFEKYMGNNPVIPYEMEERKKKFPLLFQDYSEIIEHYLQENKR